MKNPAETAMLGDPTQEGKAASAADKADATKARRSLEQRIEEASEVLRRLQDQKRKIDRAQREQNEKEIRDFIRAEKLDEFAAETWRAALTDLRAALSKAQGK